MVALLGGYPLHVDTPLRDSGLTWNESSAIASAVRSVGSKYTETADDFGVLTQPPFTSVLRKTNVSCDICIMTIELSVSTERGA